MPTRRQRGVERRVQYHSMAILLQSPLRKEAILVQRESQHALIQLA